MSDVDKTIIERFLLHISDIGHPWRPFHLHLEWSKRVTQEFFAQGDREKELGMTPAPLFDRESAPLLAKNQVGFFNFVILPSWTVFCRFEESFENIPPGRCLQANFENWKARAAEEDLAAKE